MKLFERLFTKIKKYFDIMTTSYDFKEEFDKEIFKTNYVRSKYLSILLLPISFLMMLIAIFTDDLSQIKIINTSFVISSLIIFLCFIFIKAKEGNSNLILRFLIIIQFTNITVWGSNLLIFTPNRYEMFGTYSIIILGISSLFYFSWEFLGSFYLINLIYIYFLGIITKSYLIEQPILPKLTVIVSILILSIGISRSLYMKSLNNFNLNKTLILQNESINNEVIRKTKELLDLQNSQMSDMVLSMSNLLEQYNTYTRGHCQNVANISKLIAIDLKLTPIEINETYWAGILHDVGKILIPLEILNKEGELTTEEFNEMKKHPTFAYNSFKDIKSLSRIAEYIHSHHERWDGKGYPDGLVNNEIPLISQIICIADSFDAMTSDRSYRPKLSVEKAIRIIIENKGKQFSPKVVDSFLEIHTRL